MQLRPCIICIRMFLGVIKMRDPKRIPYVLKYIQKLWENNPELRLMQLLLNIAQDEDLYHIEDYELLHRLSTTYIKNGENSND